MKFASGMTSTRRSYVFPALLAVCLLRLWVMPLASSFWVDETATAFVVTHGATDPSFSAAPQVPLSIYYVLPRLSVRWFGPSEAAYRLPSLLAACVALLLIARLAARLIDPAAAWFAAFACLALKGFDYQAADARPYALGTAVACAAAWLLVRWLDRTRWADAAAFAVMAALLWRVHLLYWPFYGVLALYTAVRIMRRETAVTWRAAALVYGAAGLALIPVAAQALSLRHEAALHVMSALPGARALLDALKPGLVVLCAAAACALGRAGLLARDSFRWPAPARKPRDSATVLILTWWLLTPVALFAFSRLTGASVFLERYLSLALPGTALAATAAAGIFLRAQLWNGVVFVLGFGVLLVLGRWTMAWPPHHGSDWRGAAAAISHSLPPDTPTICPSPFLEARPPVWRPDYPVNSFLYAHLAAYPVHAKIYPFPYDTGHRPAPQTLRELTRAPRFAIYGQSPAVAFWRSWFLARPELAGWRARSLGSFGDVSVIVIEPPES